MEQRKSTTFGVSIISDWPRSYGRKGVIRTARYMAKLGMGVQLTPMVGMRYDDLLAIKNDPELANSVLTYEGPWDKDTSWTRAWEKTKKFDKLALAGPCLFGRQALRQVEWFKELFPDAIGIDVDDRVIEISPNRRVVVDGHERPMSVEEYLEHPGGVCVDLLHIREDPPIANDILWFIRQLVHNDCVKAVQFQTRSSDELQRFVRGEWTPLQESLIALRPVFGKVPIVIELLPHHLWLRERTLLSVIKKRIEDYMR